MAGERPWLYFGCDRQPGHHLRFADGKWMRPGHPFEKFDGLLCLPPSVGERVAALTRFSAYGYSALAFWDYSIDSRGGSNSIIFAPSLTISAAEIVDGAKVHLPLYAKRWPSIDISRAQYFIPTHPTGEGQP